MKIQTTFKKNLGKIVGSLIMALFLSLPALAAQSGSTSGPAMQAKDGACTCHGSTWTPDGCIIPSGRSCPAKDNDPQKTGGTCTCNGSSWTPDGCVIPKNTSCPSKSDKGKTSSLHR